MSSSSRILIIDDNTSLGQNLREVLEGTPELDVDVRLASDGNQGLARAKAEGFDVAVVGGAAVTVTPRSPRAETKSLASFSVWKPEARISPLRSTRKRLTMRVSSAFDAGPGALRISVFLPSW